MGAVCDEAVGNGVRGDMRGDAVRGMNGGAVCHDAGGNGVLGDMRGDAVRGMIGCCRSRCGRQWGAGCYAR